MMAGPLGICSYIDWPSRKQMTWIPRTMAIPENATLHFCGRKQGLKKQPKTVGQKVVPQKTSEGGEVRTVLSDPKNRHFYLQLQLKLLLLPQILLKTLTEMWEPARRWENSHTASLVSFFVTDAFMLGEHSCLQ